MTVKTKVLIMNRQYGGIFGGVEYTSTTLANEMSARGYQCDFISLDFPDATMMYDIPKKSKWHKIAETPSHVKARWGERLKRFIKIRNIIKNYDVAIGFQDGAFLSLATAAIGTGVPVIAAERNSPSRFDHTSHGKYKWLCFQSFRLAKKITVQCPSYKALYPKYLRHKIKVIQNPVFPPRETANHSQKNIISVGRFSYQKNFDVLIKAFSNLSSELPDWKLVLVGDGDDRSKFENLIQEYKLQDRIILTGYQKDPSPYLREAQIFCLPSRWEGFPNSLAEAMALGLPSIGFEECDGVSDLIKHQENGLLAEGNGNEQSLEGALKKLIQDNNARIEMGRKAQEDMKQYNPEIIFSLWNDLFKNCCR